MSSITLASRALCAALLLLACRERPAGDGPFARQVADAIPLIEDATGLKFKTPPKVEARSKAQVRAFVLQQITDSIAMRELIGQEAAYKRFGLLPDTLRLREYLVDLLEEQIIGYYDPATKVLYVVEGAPDDMVGLTITHELVHALQDQYTDLSAFQKLQGQNDRQTAAQAVFEGQAMHEQISAMIGGGNVAVNLPGGWDRVRDMIRDNQSSNPLFESAPLIIQETLLFPYLSGAEFIRGYKTRNPGKSPFNDMPVSTEQIMHPAAYFGERDAPTTVTLSGLGGTRIYENTLGEFETRILIFQHLNDQNDAMRGATGWDGDRYALLRVPGGEALVWVTVWDSAVEAGEFREILDRAIEKKTETSANNLSPATRRYLAVSRAIRITVVEVGGRPLVIYSDAPASFDRELIGASGIGLTP